MMAFRREVRRRFPRPLGLPLVKRPESLLAAYLPPGTRLLDVGAGEGGLEGKLEREGAPADVVTVDPGGGAHHLDLDTITERFGAAALLDVVEHLDPDAGFDLLARVRARLEPGGLLFLSTPNVFKPGQFLLDATHRTPYSFEELGALVLSSGFTLEGLWRVYNAPAFSRVLHLGPLWPLHRFLGVDCARSVMAVGRKTGDPEPEEQGGAR